MVGITSKNGFSPHMSEEEKIGGIHSTFICLPNFSSASNKRNIIRLSLSSPLYFSLAYFMPTIRVVCEFKGDGELCKKGMSK